MPRFIKMDRDQQFLMPPDMREWLPEGHLAWFVLDAVGDLDLSGFYATKRDDDWGRPGFDPALMIALLFYSYASGVRSSREIERRCIEDVAFRVIAANNHPDHSTIARFRQAHQAAIGELFSQVLSLCVRMGMVNVGTVAIDGTKISADASERANRTREWIEREVAHILEEAAAIDAEEDRLYGEARGDELPPELADPKRRLERLRRAKAELDAEAAQEREIYEAKLREQTEAAERTGRRPRGRPLVPPDKKTRRNNKIVNVTDPDARVMRSAKGWITGYNAQVIATDDQVIIASALSPIADDKVQLLPLLNQAQANLEACAPNARIETLLADAGYLCERNCSPDVPRPPEMLIAVPRLKKEIKKGTKTRHAVSALEMKQKLETDRGRPLLKQRGQIVEPIFGQIKTGRGANRFMRRGLPACASEWTLLTTTHNLLKMWRHSTRNPGNHDWRLRRTSCFA